VSISSSRRAFGQVKGDVFFPSLQRRPLHKDTHQLLGEAQWASLWLPRVRLQRCRVCACAALVLCTVCMHWGRPPAELRVVFFFST
jgi:hypothetical protein